MAMNSEKDLIAQLKREYFWDVDPAKLDAVKSSRLIIERTLNYGTIKEISLILNFYGKKQVVDTVCQISYFDPKTMNFIRKFFGIPITDLKCYTRRLSMPQYWNS